MTGISASYHQQPPNEATRVVASTFGILVGLAGMEHGFFELLQGNVTPSDLMIHAIGPSQQFWEHGTETALTIIPNFFITGILAILLGLIVTVWASIFINRKYGAGILMVFSILLWLSGGGFAPIFMSIFASVAATGINKPLNWRQTHLPGFIRGALAKAWRWSIILFVVVFLAGVEIAIFGYPLLWFFDAEVTFSVQNVAAIIMIIFLPFSIITALANDVEQRKT